MPSNQSRTIDPRELHIRSLMALMLPDASEETVREVNEYLAAREYVLALEELASLCVEAADDL